MAYLSDLYRQSLTVLIDLYQITMAYGFYEQKIHEREVVFNMYLRKNPFEGDFAIACGLDLVVDILKNYHFEYEDIQYLGSLRGADKNQLFDEGFLNYLQRLEFQCDVHALPEGTIFFPNQPIIRVKGPLLQVFLLETIVLNLIDYSTLVATKAARIAQITKGETLLEFGLRRAQGIDGAIMGSRAAFIGGCHATSNVLAAKFLGIPVRGTHGHSWILCFENELDAFYKYAEVLPNNGFFLIDTYNCEEGLKNAIEVGKWLKNKGHRLLGIRIDGGDLAELSKKARLKLDAAGFEDALIVGSSDLDEEKIKEIKENGANINVWGIGARLITALDHAAIGGVYRMGAMQDENKKWHYKSLINTEKDKNPVIGKANIKRIFDKNGKIEKDILMDELTENNEILKENEAILLVPIFKNGKLVYQSPNMKEMRARTLEQLGKI